MIRDWDLVYLVARFPHLRSDFRAKFKPFTVQLDTRQNVPTEGFVAGGFVSNGGAIKKVGQKVQRLDAKKKMETFYFVFGAKKTVLYPFIEEIKTAHILETRPINDLHIRFFEFFEDG